MFQLYMAIIRYILILLKLFHCTVHLHFSCVSVILIYMNNSPEFCFKFARNEVQGTIPAFTWKDRITTQEIPLR